MRLTSLFIDQLPPPETGQKTYYDDALPGFGVRVSQGGSKSFVVMYGQNRKLKTLGRYPKFSLKDARASAKQIQSQAALQSSETSLPLSVDFSEARHLFVVDAEERLKASTSESYRWLLTRHFDYQKKLSDITRADIMCVVDSLKTTPSQQQHAFVAIRTMMNWCVKQGLVLQSPVPPISFKSKARSRILTDQELRQVWQRASETGNIYGRITQLLILTGQRRGEISRLRKSWVGEGIITFPAIETKNKREHSIPFGELSSQLINECLGKSELLFPSRTNSQTSFSGWSKCKLRFDQALQFSDYTLHDLRRTFASNHARLGTPIHVTEKMLNHVSGSFSGVAGIYNRYSYMDEMREACQKYEKWLASLCSGS